MITLDTIDAEAGGDVGRVVVGGFEPPPGGSIADRAGRLREQADWLRRAVIRPPAGDPSQSVNLILPPSTADADVGAIVMGTMGYPGFSGSNAMCMMAALVNDRRLAVSAGDQQVRLETPAGVTPLTVRVEDGEVVSVAYAAPAAHAEPEERTAHVPGWGRVAFTLAYSGVSYVVVDSADVDLPPTAGSIEAIRDLFDALFAEIVPTTRLEHPELGVMPPLTLGLIADVAALSQDTREVAAVPVAVFMKGGVICHGPTGTGTSALLAWLADRGRVRPGARLRTISPSGRSFLGEYVGRTAVGERTAIRSTITGTPRVLGRDTIVLDDPRGPVPR